MEKTRSNAAMVITAWTAVLSISLFGIVLKEIFKIPVSENMGYQISAFIMAAFLLLTFLWKSVRPLRSFFAVFAVLIGVQWLVFTRVDRLPFLKAWLNNPSFNVNMLAEQGLKLLVTLVIVAFLLILKKKRSEFFLVKGDTAAPVGPLPWLGVKKGERWNVFGRNLTIFISLGTLAFLVIAGRPPLDIVVRALPFLPAVLLAAALNAFYEEMSFKASFLSVLEGPLGRGQALGLMAAYFGIAHFYGIPYGVVGVLMAAFLGWLLGKSMLETRGFFWAWFIHFLQDVLIFAFLAIGSITPGG